MTTELRMLSDEEIRANRFELLSRLADDLAHEIKNPLNAIVINLEVLKVRAARGNCEAALERAHVIEEETRRLHGLVDRLLQLLRPDREETASLPLDQALDELFPLVEAQIRLARNDFIAECALPVFVPVRRDVFKYALLNLITATHDRLGEGGGAVSVRCGATDDQVTIAIATEGEAGRPHLTLDRALIVATALLAPCGGSVLEDQGGIVLTLPRAAAV